MYVAIIELTFPLFHKGSGFQHYLKVANWWLIKFRNISAPVPVFILPLFCNKLIYLTSSYLAHICTSHHSPWTLLVHLCQNPPSDLMLSAGLLFFLGVVYVCPRRPPVGSHQATQRNQPPLWQRALFLRVCLARQCLVSTPSVRRCEWIGYGPPCLPARSFLSAGPQQKAYCCSVGHRLCIMRALDQSAQRSLRLYYQRPTVSRACPRPGTVYSFPASSSFQSRFSLAVIYSSDPV